MDAENYKCRSCDVFGVKLWRPYQSSDIRLLCASCACADQNKVNNVDETGKRLSECGGKTDQIGWFVPAIPVDSTCDSFWGYTSVPDDQAALWRALPTGCPSRFADLERLLCAAIVNETTNAKSLQKILDAYLAVREKYESEIARLKTEGTPGVLHEVDQAFYDLVIKERNAAWAELATLRARTSNG